MSLNLITGYSGTSHITSASDGCTNAGLYGKGKYVLNIAEKFGAEIISNNLIRIKSGYAINQGRKIELAINDYEEVEIDNGLQGVKRCDLIVIHYEKNLTTGIETGSVKVIKGTSGDIYSDPAYTSGDIINGANEDDFLLYRVKINGLSIEAVEPLFTVTESLMTLLDNMQENSKKLMGEADISKIGDGTVKGAIGALADSDKKINQSLKLLQSHVGMIIQSTTLDTEAKVIAIYGGTKWTKIEGRFLLGASSSYKINTSGGEATHKLTVNEMPSHTHSGKQLLLIADPTYAQLKQPVVSGTSAIGGYTTDFNNNTGGNVAHNNMPPYKVVYIWERTA